MFGETVECMANSRPGARGTLKLALLRPAPHASGIWSSPQTVARWVRLRRDLILVCVSDSNGCDAVYLLPLRVNYCLPYCVCHLLSTCVSKEPGRPSFSTSYLRCGEGGVYLSGALRPVGGLLAIAPNLIINKTNKIVSVQLAHTVRCLPRQPQGKSGY